MDVLVLTRLYPTPAQPYQAAFMPPRLRALAAHCRLRVIVPQPRYPLSWLRARGPRPPAFESTPDYPIYRPGFFAPPGLWRKSRARSMARGVSRLVRRLHDEQPFELVLGHFLYPDGAAAAALARELRLPLVLGAHGSDVYLHGSRPGEAEQIAAALDQADGLIVVSTDLRDRLVDLGFAAEQAVVLPSGYDAARFSPRDRGEARRRLGLADEPWLCYLGALRDVKRIDLILDAVAELPGVRLALVGGGPEADRLASRARQLGLTQRLLFAGPQSHEKVPDWLAAADCLVLASDHEGTPNVIIEALAMGTPVVATAVGGVPELLGEAGRLVPRGNAAALAAAIHETLAAPPDPDSLRARVAGRSWEAVGRRQAEVLAKAAERYRARKRDGPNF